MYSFPCFGFIYMENMNIPAVHNRRCRIYYDGFAWHYLMKHPICISQPLSFSLERVFVCGSSDGLYLIMEMDSNISCRHPPFLHQTWPHHFSLLLNVLVLPSEATGWIVSCLLTPLPTPPSPQHTHTLRPPPSSFCQRKQLPPCRLLFWQLREERWKVLNHCRKLFCIQMVSMLNLPYRQWFCCVVAKG